MVNLKHRPSCVSAEFQCLGVATTGRGAHKIKKVRVFNDKTIDELCQDLDDTDLNDVYTCTNPEDAYNLFCSKLMKA